MRRRILWEMACVSSAFATVEFISYLSRRKREEKKSHTESKCHLFSSSFSMMVVVVTCCPIEQTFLVYVYAIFTVNFARPQR